MAKTRISRSQYTAVADILTNNEALSEYAKERALGRLNELVIVTNDPASLRNDPAVLALARQYAQSMPYGQAAVRAAEVVAQERNVPWVPDAWQVSQMTPEQRDAYMRSEAFAEEADVASGRGSRAQQVAAEALEYAVEREKARDLAVDERVAARMAERDKARAAIRAAGIDPTSDDGLALEMALPTDDGIRKATLAELVYDPNADLADLSKPQRDEWLRDSSDLRTAPVIDVPTEDE